MKNSEYPYMEASALDTNKRIKDHLSRNGQSIVWLSKKVGIPYKTLFSALQTNRPPRADTYAAICNALGVDYDYFLNKAAQ